MFEQFIAKRYQEPATNLLMEIATIAKATPNLIDLSIGDPDLTTDEKIINASMAAAKAGQTHYTAADGSAEFLAAVANFYQSHYGLTFEPQNIRATVGALHGMFLVMEALLNPEDEVIIHEPFFSPYEEQVVMAGGKAVIVPTYAANNFELDLADLKAAITPKTKAIIINSPNNPTGAVFSRETLAGIAALAEEHDFIILSDEVYEAFCYKEEFIPMASLAPTRTITFSSFSKTFAMTGWRLGYLHAPAPLNQVLKQINESVTYSAPSISQAAGIFALEHYDEFAQASHDLFAERLAYIEAQVAEIPFLQLHDVKGSMYAFIDVSQTGLDGLQFTEKALRETQVLVIPGLAFGPAGTNYVRLAATQDLNTLKEALKRIEQMSFN